MKHIFTVLFFLTTLFSFFIAANPARAENKKMDLTKIAKITSWLSVPEEKNMNKIFELVKSLEENEVLELVSSAEGLPLSYKIMLSGLIARHDNFGEIYKTCLERTSDTEIAICFSAYREWKFKRDLILSQDEQIIAYDLLQTENSHAKQMMSITLASLDAYLPMTLEQLIEILKQESSDNKKKNLPYNMALLTLESMTDTTTDHLNDQEKIAHFQQWLEKNYPTINPSDTYYDRENLNYINTLHRFSLKMPRSFQDVKSFSYIKGRRCLFADEQLRSLSVETHPKKQDLKATYEEMKTILEVTNQEETTYNLRPAIKFTGNVSSGQVVGILIELDDRFMFATAHSRVETDTVKDLEDILNGLSIL